MILEDPEKAPEQKEMKEAPEKMEWQTGCRSCCAKPGGCKLCCQTFLCTCCITGRLNAYLKEEEKGACPMGKCGGCCLGCSCLPCFLCRAARNVATLNEKQEGRCKACSCGLCCPCCYLGQVYRETLIMSGESAD